MNDLAIDHVFITRFNVPTPGREGLIRAKDGWLKDRIELFERFCVPAMEAQSLQNFHWLVYFDPNSPQWFIDWLEEGKSNRRFRAVFRTSVSREELVSDLRETSEAHGSVLLTTNLDNDDGLAVDFVQRLQNSVTSPTRTAVYLVQGLILSGTSTYLRSDPRNAFCSVAESWDEPVTAWADWHNRLELTMPVQEVSGLPAWLQTIHTRNVSNTVHGRLCNSTAFVQLFPYALNKMKVPGQKALLIDYMIVSPMRVLKWKTRTVTKQLLINHLGKSNFDNLKNKIAVIYDAVTSISNRTTNPRWSQVGKNRGNNHEIS